MLVRVRLVLGVAGGSLVALLRLDPAAGGPTSVAWSDLDLWYRDVGPEAAALATVRLVAMGAAVWLLAACALQVVAVLPAGRLVRPLADRIAPAALRGLAGASLSAGLLATSPLVASAGDAPGTATMHPMPDAAPPADTSGSTDPTAAAPALDPGPDLYTVSRSDSFWSIAVDRVAEVVHRAPADSEVGGYWERLVAANRDRLVDPGNADLLYAGQELVLPPIGE